MKWTLEVKDDCRNCPAFSEYDYGEYHCMLMHNLEIWYGSREKGSFPIPDNCPIIEDIRIANQSPQDSYPFQIKGSVMSQEKEWATYNSSLLEV